jgi:hypothetical protein
VPTSACVVLPVVLDVELVVVVVADPGRVVEERAVDGPKWRGAVDVVVDAPGWAELHPAATAKVISSATAVPAARTNVTA